MMMGNNTKIYLVLFCLLLTGAIQGQITTIEYFEKINENYRSLNAFELTFDYRLFKGHYGTELKDEYQSTLRIDGEKSHRKMFADEIVTTAETSLILNHQLKTIQVLPGLENEIFDQNIAANLEHCQDVKVEETENGTLLILTFKQYSSSEYGRIDILIDANFWVKQMTLYYTTQINFSNDYFHPEMDYSRVEITYGALKKNWKDKQGLTDLSNYIIKEGDLYKPTSLYQTYEIFQ